MAATTRSDNQNNTVVSGTRSTNGSTIFSKSVIPNLLNYYASYNYNISLSVLDVNSYNNANYKKSGAKGPFLAYSASQQPENRVNTVYGKFDFFIENLKIEHVVGFEKTSGNTNAIGFSFTVIEPYSMGLFFVALQQVSKEKGYKNYLDVPLLLTIDFRGHISSVPDVTVENVALPNLIKHFPLKLRLIEMRVSSKGCEYDISAYPYNEHAFEKSKVTLTTDVSIVGKTVEEMLKTDANKSLEVALNKKGKEQEAANKQEVPDKFVIEFPNLPNGTANPIKTADMGFKLYTGVDTPFAKDNFVYENGIYKRGNIEINPGVGEFKFGQGTDIPNVINQVILLSEYGRTALRSISSDGFINWWRIETSVKLINSSANIGSSGTMPKEFIYRVIPYRVSASHFLPTNTRSNGVSEDKKLVLKEYNYLYSGQNTDILDFDISFKAGFYTALYDTTNNDDKATIAPKQSTVDDSKKLSNPTQVSKGSTVINNNELPTFQEKSQLKSDTHDKGGGGTEDAASLAARQFHDAISAGVDIINVDMTILGDPFYISDSGTGNYHAGATDNSYINSDGAMAWDQGEIHIVLNFKTPVDIDLETGLYNFGNVYKVMQFSGLYRVLRLVSQFVNGKFTQTLRILRLRGQESEEVTNQLAISPEENNAQNRVFGVGVE